MTRCLSLLSLVAATFSLGAQSLPADFNGRSGASLRAAVARYAKPAVYADPARNFVDITGDATRSTFFDPFSGSNLRYSSDLVFPGILPTAYWTMSPVLDKASADLYNHIPLTPETHRLRGDLAPGKVDDATFDNGHWRVGRSTLSGMVTELYEPPAEYRGDFARIIFYMATLYPTDSWTARGYMLMDGTDYPALNGYARRLLMGYHRDDPVSAEELKRSREIGRIQGNANPFVEFPDLAEYLWGDRAGETVTVEGKPVPLRGVYSLTDERIDLTSPYVPADSRWSVDGVAVSDSSQPLSPAKLGAGLHQLRYYSPSTGGEGLLTIKIQ